MSSYDALMQQARSLMKQAENIRKTELASVIADIKTKMNEYGVTPADLVDAQTRKKTARSDKSVKYRGPNGELWSGGVGRKPEWVHNVHAKGDDIEKYRI
jgi:DNA-binding protein H-NS